MTTQCDVVAERLALGESIAPFAEHVAGCAGCARLVEMPRRIGAARRELDPGLGFAARMTAGAQHRIAVRRRRRTAAGLAAAVAAGAVGVVIFTREPAATRPAIGLAPESMPAEPALLPAAADDLQVLVNLADTDRSARLTADWRELEQPLGAYRQLVEELGAEGAAAGAGAEAGAEAGAAAGAAAEGDAP